MNAPVTALAALRTCELCTPDVGVLLICGVVGFAIGMALMALVQRAADQDDFPADDPLARPFADSDGGWRG